MTARVGGVARWHLSMRLSLVTAFMLALAAPASAQYTPAAGTSAPKVEVKRRLAVDAAKSSQPSISDGGFTRLHDKYVVEVPPKSCARPVPGTAPD